MICMVDNMEHFNCAHACWFLHYVPTEGDDVWILFSMQSDFSTIVSKKKKKKRLRGRGLFCELVTSDSVLGVMEGKASSVPRSSCVEKPVDSFLKGLQKKYEKPSIHFLLIAVNRLSFFLCLSLKSLDLINHCDQCQKYFCFDRANTAFLLFLFLVFYFKFTLYFYFFLWFQLIKYASLRLYCLYK